MEADPTLQAPPEAGSTVARGAHEEAFDRTAPLRATLDARDTPPYNLDAVHVWIVGGAITRRVRAFEAELVALPGFDLAILDQMDDLIDALMHAELWLRLRPRPRDTRPLAREGFALRRKLVRYLELRDDAQRAGALKRIRKGRGYLDLCEDLHVLVLILTDIPGALADGSPVSRADVARAREIAHELALGFVRGDAPGMEELDMRAERRKIAALLVDARDEIHAAMAWIRRREKDAHRFVPPLHVRRGKTRRRSDEAAEE